MTAAATHSPTASDCIFCKIVAGAVPCFKIYEDDSTLSFLDINPVNPGHALIIPKRHSPTLFAVPDEDLRAIIPVVKRIAAAVQEELSPDGINLHQANGPGAAQSVLHFHIHVVPRRFGDGLIVNWELRPGDKAEIAAVAERLKRVIGRDRAAG
jgi:histidine triad (HIT) family protein